MSTRVDLDEFFRETMLSERPESFYRPYAERLVEIAAGGDITSGHIVDLTEYARDERLDTKGQLLVQQMGKALQTFQRKAKARAKAKAAAAPKDLPRGVTWLNQDTGRGVSKKAQKQKDRLGVGLPDAMESVTTRRRKRRPLTRRDERGRLRFEGGASWVVMIAAAALMFGVVLGSVITVETGFFASDGSVELPEPIGTKSKLDDTNARVSFTIPAGWSSLSDTGKVKTATGSERVVWTIERVGAKGVPAPAAKVIVDRRDPDVRGKFPPTAAALKAYVHDRALEIDARGGALFCGGSDKVPIGNRFAHRCVGNKREGDFRGDVVLYRLRWSDHTMMSIEVTAPKSTGGRVADELEQLVASVSIRS